MHSADAARTTAFSDDSIGEVDQAASLELEKFGEQVALIESFKQPFPMQENDLPVIDGEMDVYG